jgi:hypothetical protein
MIGKWGEGLALGLLALVRAGRRVRIRSGSEVWIPRIEAATKFEDAQVLTVEVLPNRKARNRVCIEIFDVDQEEWDNIRPRFLFLDKPHKEEFVATSQGDLLLSARYQGKLFIKGIFVQNDPMLTHGYNYYHAGYDRDRRMVEDFDKRWNNQTIWREAVAAQPERLFKTYYDLLDAAAQDLAGLNQYSAPQLGKDIIDRVADVFGKTHGADAVPVENLGQSQELEHLGKRGIVVPPALRAVLTQKVGSIDQVKHDLEREVLKCYSWHELTADERTNLTSAIELVAGVTDCKLNEVDVVDFRSANLQGQFKDGRFAIAKRDLANRDLTLEILVHEVAHRVGGDGSKSHVACIEQLWSGIVAQFRG